MGWPSEGRDWRGEGRPEALVGTSGIWGLQSTYHCTIQPTSHEDLSRSSGSEMLTDLPQVTQPGGAESKLGLTLQMSSSEFPHNSEQMTDFSLRHLFFLVIRKPRKYRKCGGRDEIYLKSHQSKKK